MNIRALFLQCGFGVTPRVSLPCPNCPHPFSPPRHPHAPAHLHRLQASKYHYNSAGSSGGGSYFSNPQETWDRTLLLRRELTVAASEENYDAAARIKKELFVVVSQLPVNYQRLYLHLEALRDPTASIEIKRAALSAVGLNGDMATFPEVCALFAHPELSKDAEDAATALRFRFVKPAAAAKCQEGAALLIKLFSQGKSSVNERSEEGRALRRSIGAAAVAAYSDAVLEDPRCAAALAGRGACFYSLGKFEAAVEDFEAAVQLDPWHSNAARMLALARGQLKEFSLAHAALTASVVLNPLLAEDEQHAATRRTLKRWEAESDARRNKCARAREDMAADEQRQMLERLLNKSPDKGEK